MYQINSASIDVLQISSSLNVVSGVTLSATASWAYSSSQAVTASYALSANIDTSNFVTTSQTSSMTVATASWATQSLTASYVLTAQTASFVTTAQTASYIVTAQTASYVLNAVSASNANLLDGLDSTVFATTGSNTFKANQTISGSLVITGSQAITGSLSLTAGITGSLLGTASYATNALTASYIVTAQTASYVLTAQTASFVTTAQTASYVTIAQTASYYQVTMSRGGTIFNSSGITNNASYTVWRSPSSATVLGLYVYKDGASGSNTPINVWKNTSATPLTASNYNLTSTGSWVQVTSLQNTTFVAGDSLILLVSSSSATGVSVQVDMVKT